MRYLVLIFAVLVCGQAVGQAPLSVVEKTLAWKHSDSVFQVDVLGEEIKTRRLVVSKAGVTWGSEALSADSVGLEWCLWLLFVEKRLGPALIGLEESPEVVIAGERIGARYQGKGSLLLDFETNHPIRLVYVRNDVEWGVSWAVPGSWDHVLIYRNGAPAATLRTVSPRLTKEGLTEE